MTKISSLSSQQAEGSESKKFDFTGVPSGVYTFSLPQGSTKTFSISVPQVAQESSQEAENIERRSRIGKI